MPGGWEMKRSVQLSLGGFLLLLVLVWGGSFEPLRLPLALPLGVGLLAIGGAQLLRIMRLLWMTGHRDLSGRCVLSEVRGGALRPLSWPAAATAAADGDRSDRAATASRLGCLIEWSALLGALALMSVAGPSALGFSDLFLAAILGAAVFLGAPLLVIGRRQAVVAVMTGVASRFPGHLSKRVPAGVERTLESFRSALHLPGTAALLLLTSIAWGLECLGACWVFESLGTEIDVFHAVGTVVVTHLGIVLLPAAMGFGATELLGVALLGDASHSVGPLLGAILLYHAGVVLWTRALPRVLGASDPVLPGAARAASASSAARRAGARRVVVDEFVSSALPNSGPWLSFVIPAYNEERRIVSTLLSVTAYLRARRIPSEIVVVDDGSFDGTAHLVEQFAQEHPEVRLLRQARNLGKGAAVRTGMLAARGEWRVFSDADGSTPIEEVERLLAAAAGGATVVIGSRAIGSEDTRTERRLGRAVVGRVFAFFVNWWAVPGIADTQCGFKLFDRRSAEWIFERQRLDDFAFDVEILFLAQRHGLEIVEVPVNWSDVDGSKVELLRDSSRMLWAVARMRKMHRSTASDSG